MFHGLLNANREIRGHRFLVEQGTAVQARVTKLDYDDSQTKILIYEFTDHRGRKRKGSCWTSGRGDVLRDLVVGHEFDVLYAPRNSRHFVVYAAAIY